MNDLVATLKELEHLGNDSVQVIHNSVKHVIADTLFSKSLIVQALKFDT